MFCHELTAVTRGVITAGGVTVRRGARGERNRQRTIGYGERAFWCVRCPAGCGARTVMGMHTAP